MENLIHNELVVRGYSVDVGVVYSGENGRRPLAKLISSPPGAAKSLYPVRLRDGDR